MPAVDAESGAIATPGKRAFSDVRKGFTYFANSDVIVAKITPCFENGKAAIARDLLNGMGFGSTEFHVLRSLGGVLPEFLYHFVRQESFRRDGAAYMTGSVGQKRVPADWIANVELPIPPLAEQRRIVAKVEELLARVNAARERLAKVPAILKRFRQSVLAAACSGQLTADWRERNSGVDPASVALARVSADQDSRAVRRGVPDEVPPTETVAEWSLPSTWTATSAAALLRAGGIIDLKDGNHGANHPVVAEFTDQGLPFITAAQVNGFEIDYDGAYKVSGEPLARLRVGFVLVQREEEGIRLGVSGC